MKSFTVILSSLLILFSGTTCVSAQAENSENLHRISLASGVERHQGIDEIYIKFSKAYDLLDASMVADRYTETAAYLSPGSDIRIGRDKILSSFSSSFENSRKAGNTRKISFHIVQREVSGDLGFDVGIFTLTSTEKSGASRTFRGKFVVVTKKGKDGVWRFQVDGYSDLPATAN